MGKAVGIVGSVDIKALKSQLDDLTKPASRFDGQNGKRP
jgi:hypothetical protein